jgi:penicillin-binding protein 2
MKRFDKESLTADVACIVLGVLFVICLAVLAVRLKEVQVKDTADYRYAYSRQAVRRVQLAGERGRILSRGGEVLAGNRKSVSIVCDAAAFQKKTWRATVESIQTAIKEVALLIGAGQGIGERSIRRHVNQSLAMPLAVWSDVDHTVLARFLENEDKIKGFSVVVSEERVYPYGAVASHLIGYVGRDRAETVAGDEKFNFFHPEMRGRSGVEHYYDSYLKGVPGESKLLVDARGFAIEENVVIEPRPGPDLTLSIDMKVQLAAEKELRGEKGACVVMDPRNGEILAMVSQPGYNLNSFVPGISHDLYDRYVNDPGKPLLNRAAGGSYAPGSIFKPVVALAGLKLGYPYAEKYECTGVYTLGKMHIRCANRWGHGPLDMPEAIMKSCNPYFCNLGMDIGTNAIVKAAHELGLGEKTGIDFGLDSSGVIPVADWKMRTYGEKWFMGDLAQMSIGQGMLLVSPLQMARMVGAIGTGYLVTPKLLPEAETIRRKVDFPKNALKVVREGMRRVVDGGTGKRAGKDLAVELCGKTGTAEIGKGEMRRKNTWFIAYAPRENPTVALAIIIENGDSGGGTAAPKARNILAAIFGERSAE